MKRSFAVALLLFSVVALHPQDDNTVLRRVYFAPVAGDSGSNPEIAVYLQDMLYGLITSVQPIVRVKSEGDAHSTVFANMTSISARKARLELFLDEGGTRVAETKWEFDPAAYRPEEFDSFLEETAKTFAPVLGRIKPKTEFIEATREDEEVAAALEEVSFARDMSLPLELTLWVGYAGKAADRQNAGMIGLHLQFFPLVFECALFWDDHQSILLSLLVDFNDYMFFGYGGSGPAASDNVLALAGVGYEFRTTGVFSAAFVASFFSGPVIVTARENIYTGLVMPAGGTGIAYFDYLNMKLVLGFNPTRELGIKTNIGVYLPVTYILETLFPAIDLGYSMEGSWVLMQFLSIGISYRL